MFTLRQLTHALAVKEARSYQGAAKLCHLSQPALSRSIQNLENELGIDLFDRIAGEIVPTPEGEAILARAATIGTNSEDLLRHSSLLKGLEAGSFSVSFGINVATICGMSTMELLARKHPHVSCTMHVAGWRKATQDVLEGRADIAVADISDAINNTRLEVKALPATAVRFFSRRTHPLCKLKALTRRDLNQYPLAFSRIPKHAASLMPGKLNETLPDGSLKPFYETESSELSHRLVKATDAFSFVHRQEIEMWADSEEFRVLSFVEPWMTLNYGFIYLNNRTLSSITKEFIQLLIEVDANKLEFAN